MGFVPLIIDSEAEYARQDGQARSVLSLPLGVGTMMGHALKCLAELKPTQVVVLRAAGTDLAPATGGTCAVRVVGGDELDRVVEECDSSDCFLVLDTKSWPVAWPRLAELLETGREYRGATHAIAIGTGLERAIERIECDEHGQVRRVHRLYATANWPDVADSLIAWSLVPVGSLTGLRFDSLAAARQELAARGVLSRDKPVASEVVDLTRSRAYLSLSERLVAKRSRGKPLPGYRSHGRDAWLAADCQVAPTARLMGPVIVCERAIVADNAMVVGPAVIASDGQVCADAVVAQSVVLPKAVVNPGVVIRHQVYSGQTLSSAEPGRPTSDLCLPSGTGEMFAPPAVSPARRPDRRRISAVAKRVIDVTLAGSALIVLSPLLLVIAVLVKLDSHGPALFGHRREGRGGKEFRCLKFRTMVPDADARQRELSKENLVDGPQFKIADDPRVTRVGRWLRATNLDELPQLLNVVVGQMSLVGPRPSPFRENQICVAWRRARLSVRPGITGLWQICRASDRSQGDFHEWIYYDTAYVRHFSLWLDLKILLATVITLGGHRRVPMSWLIPGLEGYGRRPPRQAAA